MFLLSIVADRTSLYYVQWSITHTHYQSPRSSTLYPQTMADRTINRVGVENGQFFHPLISPRQAKRPDGRTVQMYLFDVLSKITYFYLKINLTEIVSTIAPLHASDGFKTDSASFLRHFFFFFAAPTCLFMRMLLKRQICDACFFPIWPPVAVNIHYFLVHAIIDGLGGLLSS